MNVRIDMGKLPKKAGEDRTWGLNYINDWSYNSIGPNLIAYRSILAHKSQIMDAVELKTPNAIVTCSLDHTIKAWDLSNGSKLGSFHPKHTTGVRCLDYTPDFSGYIISVGHENIIKVWSPEVSIHRAYAGCLEGHNAAVTSAKFVLASPCAISIDQKLNIRIWDIRNMTCMQVIAQDRKKFECNGLCIMSNQRKFLMYGRRIILFDTIGERMDKEIVNTDDESYPFYVEFNNYYKNFIAVTKYYLNTLCIELMYEHMMEIQDN